MIENVVLLAEASERGRPRELGLTLTLSTCSSHLNMFQVPRARSIPSLWNTRQRQYNNKTSGRQDVEID